MKTLPVSHGAVELTLLPLATAGFAIIRANEAPSLTFWISSLIGSLSVIIYAMHLGFGQLHYADLALLDDCFCSALFERIYYILYNCNGCGCSNSSHCR